MLTRTLVIAITIATSAHAAPPPIGSEDWEIMRAFRHWILSQHSETGQYCCDLSDGRPLRDNEVRTAGDHYQIFYSRAHWDDAPDPGEWLDVPPGAILRQPNPVGYTIAWVLGAHVYCVAMAGAV